MTSIYQLFPNFPSIPGLHHLISTRLGGVSSGGYASLNLGYHVGDDPACVTENRRRLGEAADFDIAALVAAQQVHGTHIAWVEAADRGRGAFSWASAISVADALIVSASDIPVAIQVADCAAVLIVDPEHHVLAVVHAGWRGALGRITSATVRQLVGCVNADPSKIIIGIGPTLCPDCLEVGEEVAGMVRAAFSPTVIHDGAVKPHLDIRAMLVEDLVDAGVIPSKIITHPDCPRCRNDIFFSHRAQHGVAGRFALIAWWSDEDYIVSME